MAVRKYTLSSIPGNINKELTFYYFTPFGGSAYSAQVGQYFVDDGELNSTHFTNLYDSQAPQLKAWFLKIN